MLSSPTWSAYDGEWEVPESRDSDPVPYITEVPREHTLKHALRKEELLQRGSQGVVYAASERIGDNAGRRVAVKRLFTQRNDFGRHGISETVLRESTLLRFVAQKLRERKRTTPSSSDSCASQYLDHNNLALASIDETARPIELLNVVEAPHKELCLVMELCDVDLRRISIKKRANALGLQALCGRGGLVAGTSSSRCPILSQAPVLRYLLRRMLRVVHFLHTDCGILHRDIKLSNFLVTKKGDLRISDFGSARFIFNSDSSDDSSKSRDEEKEERGCYTPTGVRTTLLYQPPEGLLGEATYTTAVDVWALGVVFAELVLQKHLFNANSELGMVGAIHKLLGTTMAGKTPKNTTAAVPPPELASSDDKDEEEQEEEEEEERNSSGRKGEIAPLFAAEHGTLPYKFPESILPKEGLDLLCKMLCVNPNARVPIQEALQHPYLKFSGDAQDDEVGRMLWIQKVSTFLTETRGADAIQRVKMPSLQFGGLESGDDDDEDVDVQEPRMFNIRLS